MSVSWRKSDLSVFTTFSLSLRYNQSFARIEEVIYGYICDVETVRAVFLSHLYPCFIF